MVYIVVIPRQKFYFTVPQIDKIKEGMYECCVAKKNIVVKKQCAKISLTLKCTMNQFPGNIRVPLAALPGTSHHVVTILTTVAMLQYSRTPQTLFPPTLSSCFHNNSGRERLLLRQLKKRRAMILPVDKCVLADGKVDCEKLMVLTS